MLAIVCISIFLLLLSDFIWNFLLPDSRLKSDWAAHLFGTTMGFAVGVMVFAERAVAGSSSSSKKIFFQMLGCVLVVGVGGGVVVWWVKLG